MKRASFLLAVLLLTGTIIKAQDLPPVLPCGLTGTPSNVPCYDTKAEKVIHAGSQIALPHQSLTNPFPTTGSITGKVNVPEIQAPSVTPSSPFAQVPYWTFKTNTAYYHDGSQTQQIGIEDLQGALSTEGSDQNFENGMRMGAAAGGIVGGLIGRWLAHRRQVKLERNDIKQQIVAYYDATLRLDEQIHTELSGDEANCEALAALDSPRRSLYERLKDSDTRIDALFTKLPPMLAKGRPTVLRAKDLGFLRHMLASAKDFYNISLDGARRVYVSWQFTGVLRGYFEWHQTQPNRAHASQ